MVLPRLLKQHSAGACRPLSTGRFLTVLRTGKHVCALASDSGKVSSSVSQIAATSRSPTTASPLSRLPNSSVSASLIAGVTFTRIECQGVAGCVWLGQCEGSGQFA